MHATTMIRRERIERIPAWSASGYLALARVNCGWTRLKDNQRFVLEVLAVRANDAGTVTFRPRDCLGLYTTERNATKTALFLRALRDLVRGGWLTVRRRGAFSTCRLMLPRGQPRERMERKHLYLPLQDRPGHRWRRTSGWKAKA
jgi:hypothetical protein